MWLQCLAGDGDCLSNRIRLALRWSRCLAVSKPEETGLTAVMKWRKTQIIILFLNHLKINKEVKSKAWPPWDICLCPLLSSLCAVGAACLRCGVSSGCGSSAVSEPPSGAPIRPALCLRAGHCWGSSPARQQGGSRCSSYPSSDLEGWIEMHEDWSVYILIDLCRLTRVIIINIACVHKWSVICNHTVKVKV